MDRKHKFIVLDQNVMRDSNAISSVLDRCCRESLFLLIPDVAGFELSKVSKPFDTWRGSLEFLRGYPEFVTVSRKLAKMLAEETGTGHPCNSLVDNDLTALMRQLLSALARDDPSSLQRMVDGPIHDLMPESLAAWSDSEEHKQWIIMICNELRRMMNEESLKRLRTSPQEGIAEWLSSVDGIRFIFQGIKSRGITDKTALLLSSVPSVSAAFFSASAAIAVYWLAFGGLNDASPDKLTNDLHDMEYVILGSLSVNLLSKDKRMKIICKAVSEASIKRHAWFHNRINRLQEPFSWVS
jgi:hypothetical protein